MLKLNPQEVAATEIMHSKAILKLILDKRLESVDVHNAIDAAHCALERALAELLGVRHA